MRRVLVLPVFAVLCLAGCLGVVGDPGESIGDDPRPPDERTPTFEPIPTCPPEADTITTSPLRRLSRSELDRTLADLLGNRLYAEIELELGAVPEDAPWAADGLTPLSAAYVQGMLAVATRVGDSLAATGNWLDLRHDCMASADADESCVRSFIEGFGLRVNRRPLSLEEIEDHYAFHAAAGDHTEGARRLVMRMLLSPGLLHHLEVEGSDDGGGLLALDGYAVANRISYRLLGTMPTDALLAAAADGTLSTEAGVEDAVRVLLTDDAAREQVMRFFDDWLRVDGLQAPPQHLARRYGFDAASLRTAMIDELRQFVGHQLWNADASLSTMLSTRDAFPADPALADIYGTPVWVDGSAPVQTGPERGGLLTRAAVLAHKDSRVAPIHRGVFLRRRILCDTLPSPDANIVSSRLQEIEELDPTSATTREQIELVTSPDACQGCHSMINGLAFALEDYDALGRFRTEETFYDADDVVVATHPIDSSAEIVLGEGDSVVVGSGAELVELLAGSEKVAACFARTLYEYTRHRPSTSNDRCGVARLTELTASEAPLSEVLVQNVANEAVLYRRLEAE